MHTRIGQTVVLWGAAVTLIGLGLAGLWRMPEPLAQRAVTLLVVGALPFGVWCGMRFEDSSVIDGAAGYFKACSTTWVLVFAFAIGVSHMTRLAVLDTEPPINSGVVGFLFFLMSLYGAVIFGIPYVIGLLSGAWFGRCRRSW